MSKLSEFKATHTHNDNHINIDGMIQLKSVDLVGLPVLTIIDCDLITTKNGASSIIIFKEFNNSFYFGGKALTGLCADLIGDKEAFAEMKKEGLKVQLFKLESQNGREYIAYKFID